MVHQLIGISTVAFGVTLFVRWVQTSWRKGHQLASERYEELCKRGSHASFFKYTVDADYEARSRSMIGRIYESQFLPRSN